MANRGWWLVTCGALVVVLGTGVALGSGGPEFPIPGFAASQLQVGGISRLDDGGGLIAGSLANRAQPATWHPVIARLMADGSVDLGYGSEGISTPRVGTNMRATSLAINSRTGDAWIGAASGQGGHGAIIALSRHGSRQSHFGRHGILALGATNQPVALAWGPNQLLVASGTQPCTGCRLTVIDPATGSPTGAGELAPDALTGIPGCTTGSITSAVLVDSHTAELAFRGPGPCTPELVTVTIPGAGTGGSVRATMTTALGAAASTDLVAAFQSDTCVATSSPASTALGPFQASSGTFTPTGAPGGRLIALVALGQGACAALIDTGRGSGAVVVQASPQLPGLTRDAVPRSVDSLGMFRCHAHLLVIGARTKNRERAGVVAVVPVRRGTTAGTARAAIAGSRTGRCH